MQLLWDSRFTTTVWHAWYGGMGFNPPRDVAMPDRPFRKPAWALPRYVLGPYHHCGCQLYYQDYFDNRPVSCVRCKTRLVSARQALWRQYRAGARPTPHIRARQMTLWQLIVQGVGWRCRGRLVPQLPPERKPRDQRQHHCAEFSSCRTKAGRKRIEASKDMVSMFRCWTCDCFFPVWVQRERAAPRLCHACEDHLPHGANYPHGPTHGDTRDLLWPVVTMVRQAQALWTEIQSAAE